MSETNSLVSDPRPASAVSSGAGLMGLLGLAIWVMIARNFGAIAEAFGFEGLPARADGPNSALVAVFCCGVLMVLWSVLVDKVHLRKSTGIDWKLARPIADVLDTSIVKIAGLWATWAGIAAIYGLGRFYWAPPYDFSMQLFGYAVVPLVVISIPYVVWLDRYLVHPRDGSWHFGAWIAGRDDWDRTEIFHHLRAWAVKGFFLAFMLSGVHGGFRAFVNVNFSEVISNPVWLTNALMNGMMMVDMQLATVGYMLTLKPLDAHIRTANPYLAGWVAALMCYPPFILVNSGRLIDYKFSTAEWDYWLQGHDALLWMWGGVMILLTGVYAWATMAFGLRFSNLTDRGILTHGPYAFTKHPAYLSKNSFWWLGTLPFLVTNGSMVDAIRNTVMMGLVSLIYFWRAKTEEKHLMADPDYRAYAEWMDRNAAIPRFFGWLRRLVGSRLQRDMGLQPAE